LAAYCRWWDHKARKWYYHSIQGEEEANAHDWSEILMLCSHWPNIAGGGITRPESDTTIAFKERRRPTVMIGQKFCCSALIGCLLQVVGSQGQKVVLPQHTSREGGGRSTVKVASNKNKLLRHIALLNVNDSISVDSF
jgi:hypothetical protein